MQSASCRALPKSPHLPLTYHNRHSFFARNVTMADPLSIAASVAGLLTVAVKISAVISDFISSINDVPESARAALTAVEGMRLTLTSVKQLIDRLSQLP